MSENKYPIGGYAPGNYINRCCDCGQSFNGDKRAVQCEPCAIYAKEKFDALSPAEQEELLKRNAEIMNELIKNNSSTEQLSGTDHFCGKTELNNLATISDSVNSGYAPGEIKFGQLWARHSELVTREDLGKYRIDFEGLKKAVNEALSLQPKPAGAAQRDETPIPAVDHDQAHINMDAGMPDFEAYYQAGFSNGHDIGYDKAKKEVRPTGAVWIKGDYDRLYQQLKADVNCRIVCYVDYNTRSKNPDGSPYILRDICSIWGENMEFGSRGIGYGSVRFMPGDYKENFISLCTGMNVEWLDESGTPKMDNETQITAALRKFVSMHEAGLLPNRFTYEEGKKALEGDMDR